MKYSFKEILLDFIARISSTKFLLVFGVVAYYIYKDYQGTPIDIDTVIGTTTAVLGYSAINLTQKAIQK